MKWMMQASLLSKIFRANLTKKWFPLIVSLTVTNRCNLKCIYCYGSYYDRQIKDFPVEVWLDLIDELAQMGTSLIHLEGGEPLLRDDIELIIRKVKSKKMMCRMNSNGLLVPAKIAKLRGLDSLCVSLDGDSESNDRNRGKGTYPKILEGIKAAKKQNIPVLTSTVITNNNIHSGAIENILALSKEIGFGAQFSFLYEQTTLRLNDSAFSIDENAIKNAIKKLIAYKKSGYPIFYSLSTYKNALRWPVSFDHKRFTPDFLPPKGWKYINCYMGKLMCFVDGDGMVYPCGEHIGSFPALNFLQTGFKKAWDNIEMEKKCITCYNTCFNEYNQIFSCRPSVIWNNFMNYFKFRK